MGDDPRARMIAVAACREVAAEIEAKIAILRHKVEAVDEVIRRMRQAEKAAR